MLSLLLPCAFSCCLLEMEASSKVPSDVLLPSLLDPALEPGSALVQKVMLKVMEAQAVPFSLPSQLLSCFSLLKKPHQYWVLKVGCCVLWNSGTPSDRPPLMIPAPGGMSGTCMAAPLLFIGIPSCGFLPFYFSVCKFTFFNTCESSTWSSSTRTIHFLQRKKQCLVLQPLTFQDFPQDSSPTRHPLFTPTEVCFTLFRVCKQVICRWGRFGNTKCDL